MIKILSSVRLTVVALFLLFVLTFWGTVAQVEQGLYAAQERFFASFFFLAGGWLPFPGAQLVLWVLFINLVSMLISDFDRFRRWSSLGNLIIHLGLLLYFIAAFCIFHLSRESYVRLMEGTTATVSRSYTDAQKTYPLPFTLRLDRFKAGFYPGTSVAQSYESWVTISASGLERQVRIHMNHPLTYQDYTIFQASYDKDARGRQYSTLAVVKNAARGLPYAACLMVFFGLALHFLIQAFAAKNKL